MEERHSRPALVAAWIVAASLAAGCQPSTDHAFRSEPPPVTRTWIGGEFWSNPLQDWRIRDGRIECLTRRPNRNVALLTHDVSGDDGDLHLRVRLGWIAGDSDTEGLPPGWAGFRLGARGAFHDHRDTALRGAGLNAGIHTSGFLFVGDLPDISIGPGTDTQADEEASPDASAETLTNQEASRDASMEAHANQEAPPDASRQESTNQEAGTTRTEEKPGATHPKFHRALIDEGLVLDLTTSAREDGRYDLRLRLERPDGTTMNVMEQPVDGDQLTGGVALVADLEDASGEERAQPSFWFEDWSVSGSRVRSHPERAFGPILFSLHTLSKGSLGMTAQMPPLSEADGKDVLLQIHQEGRWKNVGRAPIHPMARTATFHVDAWPDSVNVPYRLVYESAGPGGTRLVHDWEGTVRKDPSDRDEIVVAGFTGNNDLGFPHADLVERVRQHDPDILLFTGDNIYESVGGYGHVRTPLETAMLDYLRKWYLFGWEYRELTKDIPTVTIPDDHDVYHGNVWGAGGRATGPGNTMKERQDTGGYTMPAAWVNAVQRTQTAHLPHPFDPTPVEQDIGVYYTDLTYGGVSFAIIEDRKWKSPPKRMLPAWLDIENGWAENQPTNPPGVLHAPQARLLGSRQLDFLEHWAADWSHGAWMKMLMSQTIFANVATLPDEAPSDVVVPHLEIVEADDYVLGDRIVQDMDSNGWPKHARDRALRVIRKGFAFHLAGDQHLGSTIRYGVDTWGDAGYALCVPSVANFYPRRWYPPVPGANRPEGGPPNTGDFLDGFGNPMTVFAVSNPYATGMKPAQLYDRAPGYGIVRLNRTTRKIHVANWPRHVDPKVGAPYPGWPITINQLDNYGREAIAWLPEIRVQGMKHPVVQVIEEATGEIAYTLRIRGNAFTPKVFRPGSYTVRVGNPDGEMHALTGVQSAPTREAPAMEVAL